MKHVSSPNGYRSSSQWTQKSKAILACVILAGALAANAQNSPYYNAVTALNPVGYWPLQETTQPPATFVEPNVSTNASGPGALANIVWASTGTANLQPSFYPPGASGNSTFFEAANSSSFGIVPTTDNRVSLAPGQPFSVELWIYPRETGQYQGILVNTGPLANPVPNGGNNAGNYKAGWAFNQNYVPMEDGGSGTQSGPLFGWSFAVWNGTGNFGGAQALAPVQYMLSTWYHIACVFDGVNARIYVNGTLASPPDACIPMPAGTSFLPDTWDPIEFGCSRGLDANQWTGNMGNVAIYNYALTTNQIANHYAASQGNYEQAVFADNPYMFWHMNGNPFFSPASPSSFPTAANYGTGAANINNLDYNGSLGSSAVYQPGTVPGVAGPSYAGFGNNSYACAFNGINGVVDAGYEAAMNPTTTSNFSVVGWFKDNPSDNNGRINTLVSHSQSSWRVEVVNGVMKFNPGLGTGNDLNGPSVNVNDGHWHMFAATVTNTTGNNSVATLYIDAASSTTVTNTTAFSGKTGTNILFGGAPDFAQGNYYLYNSAYNSNYNTSQQYYAGQLAHVAYFSATLTSSQVQSLYNAAEASPLIVTQPASVAGTNNGGGTNTFAVTASGAATLTYQWYLTNAGVNTALANDSVHINGATSPTLTITNTVSSESGSYYVVVGNAYGSVTSALASLHISSPPTILSQTGGGALQMVTGQYYTLTVTAVGDATLSYQWYTNGVADTTAGATSAYALTAVQPSQTGTTYQCIVANSIGSATNVTTTLTVESLPSSLTGNAYSASILALNPSAYWPMHEVSPGVPGDTETNLGTLGIQGNAFYGDWDINFLLISNYPEIFRGETGALANDPDPATRFNRGYGSYMIVPHIAPAATIKPPFTAEAWVLPTDNHSFGVFLGQGGSEGLNGNGNSAGFYLSYSGPNISNSFELSIFTGSGSTRITATSQPLYPEGSWYHVVGTYDGTNLALYVNGQSQGSIGYGTGSVNSGTMAPDTYSPLSVGSGPWSGADLGDPFMGVVDEVAVYNTVLSSTRIAKHYNDALTAANGVYKSDVLADSPLLYFRMDAPAYTAPPTNTWTVLNNYGSNYMPGVYTPGTVPGGYSAALITGISSTNAMPGNGMGAYAIAGMGPGDNPLGYTSFSYSAFFRAYPNDGGARQYQSIMSANDADWRASINGSSGKCQIHGNADQTSSNVFNDGNWHQFVLTAQANATAGNFTNILYVDGVVQATGVSSGTNTPSNDPGPLGLIGNEYGFSINNSSGNPAGERCFAGAICEAAFFMNQVLTPATVSNLYLTAGVAPFFGIQPVSTNINGGLSFTNTVAVGGSGNSFSLQWYTNGVALPGQTGTTLVFNPVTAANSSQAYYCVVSNSYGVATSSVASLKVITVPIIVSSAPSPNLTLLAGATVPFSVSATGAAPLSYIWSSNGNVLAGVTGTNFTLTNATVSSAGTYSVTVSNSYGTASASWQVSLYPTSGPFQQAVLALHPVDYWLLNEPGNGQSPVSGVTCVDYIGGNNGTYEATILGVSGYDFFDNSFSSYDTNTAAGFQYGGNSCAYGISNIDVSSSTQSSFTVQAWALATGELGLTAPGIAAKGLFNNEEFTMDCAGNTFRFEVRNAAGTAINATTSVASSDGIWHLLVGVCDEVHGAVTMYIDGTNAGSAAIATNGGILNNDVAVPMSIGSRSSAGSYSPGAMDQQFVGNVADVALFKYALTAAQVQNLYYQSGFPPTIIQQPPAVTNVTAGGTLTVSVSVAGTTPITYQWYDANGPVSGQTNSTLVVSNDQGSDTYYLTANNLYGSTNSQPVAVTVNTFPIVTSQTPPSPLTILPGASVTFSATATGTAPLYYFWQSNGVYIAGATNTSYTLTDASASSGGTYSIIVSNHLGTATGSWTLIVQPPSGGFLPAALALGPIDYYMLNEPSGSTVCLDYIRGNNGVYENTTLGVPGYGAPNDFTANYDTNTAAQFGVGFSENSCAVNISNIDFTTASNLNAEFTVQCWVQGLQEISDVLNTPGLVGKGLYNNEEFALDCGTHLASGVDAYRFSVRNAAGTAINAGSSLAAGADNNWHFLVGVCDQANDALTLYIDGTNAASVSMPPGSGVLGSDASIPMMIGARTSGSPYNTNDMNEQFVGNMADVALYNYALSSNQVLNEYLASGVAPSIAALPATIDSDYGGTLQITPQIVGTAQLYYQWYDTNGGGTAIAGQTNATLTVSNDTVPNSYYVVVWNLYGTNTSTTAAVVLLSTPTIIQDITPSNAVVVADSALTLSVVVDGQVPITYGWQKNGQAVANSSRVSGATTSVLTINPVETSDAGTYQLYATNGDGVTSSSAASVQVVPNLSFNGNGAGWIWQTNNGSSLVWSADSLQLTDDIGSEDSAAFFPQRLNISAFKASFTYQVPTGSSGSADGTSFCIQNDSRGPAAVGDGGGGLGVEDIAPSVELELNIYSGNGLGGVGISLNTDGGVGPVASTSPVVINSGDPIAVAITYQNGVASVSLTDTSTDVQYKTSAAVNIPTVLGTNMAYVGFTGADGGSESRQVVTDFSFVNIVSLTAQVSGTNLVLTWPAGTGGYALEQSSSLSTPVWSVVAQTPTVVNNQNQVVVPEPVSPKFYQLKLTNVDQ